MPHPSPVSRFVLRFLAGLLATLAPAQTPDLTDLPPGHSLVPRAVSTDSLGRTHTRLEHRYLGLRVWGSEFIDHGPDAAPSPSRALPRRIRLGLEQTPTVDTSPTLAPAEAQAAVRAHLGGAAASFPEPELVLVPQYVDQAIGPFPGQPLNAASMVHALTGYTLAYLQRAEPGPQAAPTDGWDYLVDAHSGAILQRLPLAQSAQPAKGIGNTLYSDVVSLDTTDLGIGFALIDGTRGKGGEFGGNWVNDWSLQQPASSVLKPIVNTENTWGDGRPEAPLAYWHRPNARTVAADAAWGMQVAWDYFKNVHSRLGIANDGVAAHVSVHGPLKFDNAGWAAGQIFIFPSKIFWPMADRASLGHEWTHGVTDATAKLIYKGESGGLNEATSDIFGVLIESYGKGDLTAKLVPDRGTNWGVWVHKISGSVADKNDDPEVLVRFMIKPSRDGRSPDAWTPGLADLDPHLASGPMNRAFYFLAVGASDRADNFSYSADLPGGMTGVGNDHAARIWYQALTSYLKPDSTYLHARKAALAAASDLYGATSTEVAAVRKAFAAIRVGSADAPPVDVTPSITLQQSLQGADLTLTTTSTGIKAVNWMIDGIPVGSVNQPPFTLTLDAGRLLANGAHTLSAFALDVKDSVSLVQGSDFTLANPYQQLLQDPGLEQITSLSSPWKGDLNDVSTSDYQGGAHGGNRYAQFDSKKGREQLTLTQTVTIPAGAQEATLSFWAWTQADPTEARSARLVLRVRSVPGPGQDSQILDTLLGLLNRDVWPDWRKLSVDLTRYAGQTIQLSFESLIPIDSSTIFRIDDCSLLTAATPMVDVLISPGSVALATGTSQTFNTAVLNAGNNTAINWSIRESAGGSLSGNTYTAPSKPGFYHLLAASAADPRAKAEVSVQVLAQYSISPATVTLEAGTERAFVITAPDDRMGLRIREGQNGGSYSMNDKGITYFAGSTPGTYHLDVFSPGNLNTPAATATVTVVAATSVTLALDSLTVATGSTIEIGSVVNSALQVLWAVQEGAAGGTVVSNLEASADAGPYYAAPATPGVYHLIITSAMDPAKKAVLTITVVAGVAINPPSATVVKGRTRMFFATVPGLPHDDSQVTWSASGGEIDEDGDFSSDTPGVYLITATPVAGGAPATATVTVTSGDLDGDGETLLDFGDLAVLADDYGATPTSGQVDPSDLNGDGVVDDEDVKVALADFEGQNQPAAPAAPKRPAPARRNR